jgi:hypothetical protein
VVAVRVYFALGFLTIFREVDDGRPGQPAAAFVWLPCPFPGWGGSSLHGLLAALAVRCGGLEAGALRER